MKKPRGEQSAQLTGGTWVAIGMVITNIAVYGFNIVAARLLMPEDFGAVTALLGVFLIGNVVSMALQATVARRIAVAPDAEAARDIARAAMRATFVIAVGVAALIATSGFLVYPALRLDSIVPVLVCGIALLPHTILGSLLGIAQGSSRWKDLASLYVSNGFARLFIGGGMILLSPTVTTAMVGLALATWLPVVLGMWRLRTDLRPAHDTDTRPLLRELLGGSHALLAYFVLSNMDAIIARNVLSGPDSGLYASGLILAKAALFFPQFVSVVLFPDMARATGDGARKRALALVVTFGVLAVAATALLPRVALILVGGNKYAEITDTLWLFAVAGAALAVVHLLVFDALARHAHGIVFMLWIAVAAVIAGAYGLDVGIAGLATVVAVVAGMLAVAAWFVPTESTSPGRDDAPLP